MRNNIRPGVGLIKSLDGIRGTVIKRLVIAWTLLSVLVGVTIAYLEMREIDSLASGLAITALDRLRAHVTEVGEPHTDSLRAALLPLIGQGYLRAQVSDLTGKVIAEASAPDQIDLLARLADRDYSSGKAEAQSHRVLWLSDGLIVLVHEPLLNQSGHMVGKFSGTYQIDAVKRQQALSRLARNVSMALLAILATTIALYPVIIRLNKGVLELASQLMRSNMELMEVLGGAIAKRDSDTDLHNYRVCLYSIRFAQACGFSVQDICAIITGAFLHDVGKIGISDSILLKPGKLTAEEFEVMKKHVQLGADIISKSSWLDSAREIIEFHHEKFDGTGYLSGLQGEAIPLAARLFAIVDVFDALTSRRPYKASFPIADALGILAEGRGSHFDPALLSVFEKIAVELHAEIIQLPEAELKQRLKSQVTSYFVERT